MGIANLKVVCLISGGIDSPVAAYLMTMRGAEMILLHMDNRPYSDDTGVEKVQDLRDRLELVTGQTIRLFIAPHGRNQEYHLCRLPERIPMRAVQAHNASRCQRVR